MKTLPTQERALVKRQALIDSAISEFSTIGFEAATAKSIAQVAGVATGTFYQYFENKNDILRVIAIGRFEGLDQRIQLFELKVVDRARLEAPKVETQFLETLMLVHQFHARDPQLHQVLEQRRALDTKLQKIMGEGESVLRKRVLTFVQSFNISNSELVAENLFAMAEGLVHRLVFHSATRDTKNALTIGAKMLASYFIDTETNHLRNLNS